MSEFKMKKHPRNTNECREEEKFIVNFASGTKYKNSAIIFFQRLLNQHCKVKWLSKVTLLNDIAVNDSLYYIRLIIVILNNKKTNNTELTDETDETVISLKFENYSIIYYYIKILHMMKM